MTTAPTVPIIRTSERSDFKKCPFLWQKSWVEQLSPMREPTWAWFGSAIHSGLEARYLPGGTKRASLAVMLDAFEERLDGEVRKIYTAGGDLDDTEIVDGRLLGRTMLAGYVEHYGKEAEWDIIHTEQPFQIDVPGPDGKVIAVYAGTWDLFARNRVTKDYWIWDHKSRKAFVKDWSFYGINDQAGSYLWVAPQVLVALGLFKKPPTIEGLVFNILRKHMPDDRPVNERGQSLNKDGSVSKVQPQPLFHREEIYRSPRERVTQGQRVQAEAQAMQAYRDGTLPLFKTPTEDCTRCKIFEYCELQEHDPEAAEEFARFSLKRRDPYADHREDMLTKKGVSI